MLFKILCICLGNLVAIKQISKRHTSDSIFQREMDAFLHIRMAGDHPNICGLRENFDEGDYYYLVLDLIQGKFRTNLPRGGLSNPPGRTIAVRCSGSSWICRRQKLVETIDC